MSRGPSIPAAAQAVLKGDRRALAKLITAVENDEASAAAALRSLYAHTGRARVIGFTGPLGVGKSSVINALLQLLRGQKVSVGVLAVDPSSPFSGGSVLGDRVRLDRRTGDQGVFIRSMASRGHTGGVSRATREVVRLLDAFGMDVILVETVGSGQVDVDVREVASTSVVVLVPNLGDEVQTLKAGLFEIADVFCLNKSDLSGVESARRDLTDFASLGEARDGWSPAVISTSVKDGTGFPELWDAIERHEKFLDDHHLRKKWDRTRATREIIDVLRTRWSRALYLALETDPTLSETVEDVVARRIDPREGADRVERRHRRSRRG